MCAFIKYDLNIFLHVLQIMFYVPEKHILERS